MASNYTNTEALHQHETVFLSQNDVDRLLSDTSADSRISVLSKISIQYHEGDFHAKELILAEQIFRVLMKDSEIRDRQVLADKLQNNLSVPRDIILHLAKDKEVVSRPILKSSKILSDADLIEIIETSKELGKLLAISKRERVSIRVSDTLIETSHPQVIASLIENNGALISTNRYEDIVTGFSGDPQIINALVKRSGLPLDIVESLLERVTGQVAEVLQKKYNISAKVLKKGAKEAITLSLVSFDRPDEEIEVMITQMMAHNRLTPSLILSSLCKGHLSFFEIALAKIADIPRLNARKLIHDKGSLGFKAIYSKTELPESMFDAVQLVLISVKEMREAGMQPETYGFSGALVERVVNRAQDYQIDNLPYVIALIRQS